MGLGEFVYINSFIRNEMYLQKIQLNIKRKGVERKVDMKMTTNNGVLTAFQRGFLVKEVVKQLPRTYTANSLSYNKCTYLDLCEILLRKDQFHCSCFNILES
jgi:hypothetical protein